MLEKLTDDQYNKLMTENKGLGLDAMFVGFEEEFGCIEDNPEIKEMFLEFMGDLIRIGELKLANWDNFLVGSIEEQIDLFRQAWPKEYDDNDPQKDIHYFWWLVGAPAGAVWIWEDGYEDWTWW
ncbi:hypothetical protein EV693_102233 [Nicoletella semolina]|uniref:DUF596 domain-containing protein n=1 Tax=Nicoletella semolina TaxID=271160 RepID=A0A4R2NBQ1_9PAST|nr:DUF596 domain-containing protein [Nicoletella semolina]MDH2925005.1 hypothetical protein [Nicoletella semolina]TCP18553.1 hypothetical protein EV693_102233 [Nicoletella semolina]